MRSIGCLCRMFFLTKFSDEHVRVILQVLVCVLCSLRYTLRSFPNVLPKNIRINSTSDINISVCNIVCLRMLFFLENVHEILSAIFFFIEAEFRHRL